MERLLLVAIALLLPAVYATPVKTLAPPAPPPPPPPTTPTTDFIHTVICPDGFNNYQVCRPGEGCSVTCVPADGSGSPTVPTTPPPTKPPKSVVEFLANGTFDTKAQTITFNIN